MDRIFSPVEALAEGSGAYAARRLPTALVLPTTAAVRTRLRAQSPPWLRIGDGPGTCRPTAALARLREPAPPRLLVSHCDQLCNPADTTVQSLRAGRALFLSPIDIILNSKYGFRLMVWTATGLVALAPRAEPEAVASALLDHLRDCELLGDAWEERSRQVERTPGYRDAHRRRQLRFLESSVANAYAHVPGDADACRILERIAGLRRTSGQVAVP